MFWESRSHIQWKNFNICDDVQLHCFLPVVSKGPNMIKSEKRKSTMVIFFFAARPHVIWSFWPPMGQGITMWTPTGQFHNFPFLPNYHPPLHYGNFWQLLITFRGYMQVGEFLCKYSFIRNLYLYWIYAANNLGNECQLNIYVWVHIYWTKKMWDNSSRQLHCAGLLLTHPEHLIKNEGDPERTMLALM